jgi:hypothetical protein
MSLKIRRTGSEEYGRYIKALLCGESGSGKTLTASTWPNPFYASAEGGLMSIADRNIPYAEIRSSPDLLKIKMLMEDSEMRNEYLKFPVETVVIDTIDEIQRILVRERLEETGQETMKLQDWGWLSEQMASIIRGFRNLPMNVVFTCHVKEVTDSDTGKVTFKPGLQGAIADQITGMVDLSLLLKSTTSTVIENNQPVKVVHRALQTVPDYHHQWIKDRSGKLPSDFVINFKDDFQRIHDLIFKDIGEMQEGVQLDVDVPDVPKFEALSSPKAAAASLPKAVAPVKAPPKAPVKPAVAPPVPVVAKPTPTPSEAKEAPTATPMVTPEGGLKIRNEKTFPVGLNPQPKGHGTDIYCESCGVEVEDEDRAELSRIRFRKIMCEKCFQEQKR